MFINAVCDEYDELAVGNNCLVGRNAELLASEHRKDGVIQYLQDQNAGLLAENNTLREMQKQAAGVNSSTDLWWRNR